MCVISNMRAYLCVCYVVLDWGARGERECDILGFANRNCDGGCQQTHVTKKSFGFCRRG
jgi:hypothetical protein